MSNNETRKLETLGDKLLETFEELCDNRLSRQDAVARARVADAYTRSVVTKLALRSISPMQEIEQKHYKLVPVAAE